MKVGDRIIHTPISKNNLSVEGEIIQVFAPRNPRFQGMVAVRWQNGLNSYVNQHDLTLIEPTVEPSNRFNVGDQVIDRNEGITTPGVILKVWPSGLVRVDWGNDDRFPLRYSCYLEHIGTTPKPSWTNWIDLDVPKCDCGALKAGTGLHAHWCSS